MKKNILLLIAIILSITSSLTAQNALHFDGVNDKVQTTYGGVTGTVDRTFEAWIYLSSTPTANMAILDYGQNAAGSRNTFYVNSSLKLGFISGGTNANLSSSIGAVTINQWNHVAFVLDSGTGYLYVDGVQVGTGSLSNVDTPTGNSDLIIGERVSGGSIPFGGIIDEVRIWNYAKTVTQIIADTGKIICPPHTGLVAYHNFDHGIAGGSNATVTTSADSSGSSNDGTLSGFALTGTTSNWVVGKTLNTCYPVCLGPTQTLVECDGFTITVGGNTHSTTGVYSDTLVGVGCDSIIVTDLTINPIPTFTQTLVECTGYSVTVGTTTYTTTGIYLDTLVAASSLGCDSIVTTDLTVGSYKTTNQSFSECNGFTISVGINTYSTTGIYHDTLVGAATGGCDSIVNTDLTILNHSSYTDVIVACDSYTWMDGITYTSSNTTAKDTILNAVGCDSIITLNLTVNVSTASVDVQAACDSYTWMNGATYTSSNSTAIYILPNTAGCDSVVTLNLTITNNTTSVDVQSACGSYAWMNGNTYYTSNFSAKDTLLNTAGCDSVITLNLTIHPIYATTDVQTVCDSLTWVDGVTYYSNNSTATYITTSVSGCDSVATLNLTLINSTVFTDMVQACGSYTWINGVTYTASNNTAKDTLISSNGCDSIVMLDLTMGHATSGDDIVTACDSLTWINGITYYSNNINTYDTITNASGCDSVVRLFLTISPIDVSTSSNWEAISANAVGLIYQWIDCSDNSIIVGATNNTYIATVNGSYAVIITNSTCSDTSDCVNLTNVGINEITINDQINIYPNPVHDQFTLEITNWQAVQLDITVVDVNGKTVSTQEIKNPINSQTIQFNTSKWSIGVYFIQVSDGVKISNTKLILQ